MARRRGLATPLVLLALCALGVLLRTGNAATVFVDGAVVFAENDPYYHMRRVFQIVAGYPRIPYFDPWIDFPHGAPVVFAPLFDFAIATLARAAGWSVADRGAIETMAALLPPLLGALTCLPVYAIARQVASPRAALLAAAMVTLMPAHIWYSRLGFVDHHVAVTLLQVILCALVLRALGVGRDERPRAVAGMVATLVMATGLLTWNGFLLLVAVLDLGLLALFVAGSAQRRVAVARLSCLLHLGAALLVLPAVIATVRTGGAAASSVTLSYLHVAVLVAVGGLAAAAAAAVRRGWPLLRTLALVALAVAALGGALLDRAVLARVVQWTLASDPFMSSVQESVSILRAPEGGLDLDGPQVWMSRFFLAAPLLFVWLAVRVARRRGTDAGRLFVLVWSGALFVLTLGQRRFGEVLAPALAVLAADALDAAGDWLARLLAARGVGGRGARALASAVALLLVALAFAPYYGGYVAEPQRLLALPRVLQGRATAADLAEQEGSSDVRLARALTRFGGIARRADPNEAFGVMNAWPLGHKLLYVSGVPVTATPFGSYVGGSSFDDWIDFLLATDEARALALLAERRSRFVVVDNDLGTIGAAIVGRGADPRRYYAKEQTAAGMAYTFLPPLVRSLYVRLTRLGGSEALLRRDDGSNETIPALDHLRLVLDSASDDEPGFPKVYEVVRGATLVVRGAPGRPLAVHYAWQSDAGRQRMYEKSARLGADGTARVVLPYSSEREDLGQTSAWLLETGDTRRELRVAEDDVRDGREIALTLD